MKDPGPLPPEHLIYEFVCDEIRWNSYLLTCPECGSDHGWTLRVQQEPWTSGEDAWALCPLGHRVFHPLVYPKMVHALITWAAASEQDRPGSVGDSEALKAIGWHPHYRDCYMPEDVAADEPSAHLRFRSWNLPDGPPYGDYWHRTWPALIDAARHRSAG
jgi:hypothetical protein